MADLDQLLSLIRPSIRNCPDPLLRAEAIRAARRFCQETRYLRETQIIDVVTDQYIYTLAPESAFEEVTGIKAATYNKVPLGPMQPEEQPPRSGNITHYWYDPRQEIWINGMPTADLEEGLWVNLIRIPKRDATELHDDLFQQDCDQIIANGAMARLFLIKGEWADPGLAKAMKDEWENGIRIKRHDAALQHRSYGNRSLPGFPFTSYG